MLHELFGYAQRGQPRRLLNRIRVAGRWAQSRSRQKPRVWVGATQAIPTFRIERVARVEFPRVFLRAIGSRTRSRQFPTSQTKAGTVATRATADGSRDAGCAGVIFTWPKYDAIVDQAAHQARTSEHTEVPE